MRSCVEPERGTVSDGVSVPSLPARHGYLSRSLRGSKPAPRIRLSVGEDRSEIFRVTQLCD